MSFLVARSPDEVKKKIQFYIDSYSGLPFNERKKGAITGRLNEHLGGDENRHIVLNWLFGVSSSKELDDSQWDAVFTWIGFVKDESGSWEIDGRFPLECGLILTRALREQRDIFVENRLDGVEEENLLHQTVMYMDGVVVAVGDGEGVFPEPKSVYPIKVAKERLEDKVLRSRLVPPEVDF